MKVSKWGNSLAIRLTNNMATQLNVAEGDEVDVRVTANLDGFTIRKKLGREELRERVRAMRGLRPAGMILNREEFNEG
jgi:antitoxin component of MazEF toxin-antitoxin module